MVRHYSKFILVDYPRESVKLGVIPPISRLKFIIPTLNSIKRERAVTAAVAMALAVVSYHPPSRVGSGTV